MNCYEEAESKRNSLSITWEQWCEEAGISQDSILTDEEWDDLVDAWESFANPHLSK